MKVTNKEKLEIFNYKLNFYGEKEKINCTNRQYKKLSFWLREKGYFSNKSNNQNKKQSLYNNKSNTELNTHQKCILDLGPKYILEEKIDLKFTIRHIEKALTFFPETERNRIRNKVQENLRKIEIHSKDSEDIKELRKLKNNEEIACIHTDKTGKIVILNKKIILI